MAFYKVVFIYFYEWNEDNFWIFYSICLNLLYFGFGEEKEKAPVVTSYLDSTEFHFPLTWLKICCIISSIQEVKNHASCIKHVIN